jgi:hypothetical protein
MPGTSNITKLMVWLELICRLKTFVYRFPYHEVIDTIGQLNSNSRYRQFVEALFGPVSTYLDLASLATDMEKPVYIVKNCAAANKWDRQVTSIPLKDITGSQLHSKWYAKLKHLNESQLASLEFLAEAFGNYDRISLFEDIIVKAEKYIRSYPSYEAHIRALINPKLGNGPVPAKSSKKIVAGGVPSMFFPTDVIIQQANPEPQQANWWNTPAEQISFEEDQP